MLQVRYFLDWTFRPSTFSHYL